MSITASQLRNNVYRLLDEVIDTGKPLKIERKGRVVMMVPLGGGGKLQRLTKHACIQGDPEDLVHIDWSGSWTGDKP